MDLIEEILTEWDNPSLLDDTEIIKKFENYLYRINQDIAKFKTKLFVKEYESVRDVHIIPLLTSSIVREEYKKRARIQTEVEDDVINLPPY